jgi:hypothetical protein
VGILPLEIMARIETGRYRNMTLHASVRFMPTKWQDMPLLAGEAARLCHESTAAPVVL